MSNRILFVEDELSKNIPRILNLFSGILNKEEIEQLNSLEADESGYGAEPEEIKGILEKSNLIEVEYRFPDALRRVMNNYKDYVLFIVDRNLSEEEYNHEEILKIDPKCDKPQYKKYCEGEREGDYLLEKLVPKNVDVLSKFYFLTAYSAKADIRSSEDIKKHIDFKRFTAKNIIEKGDQRNLNKLKEIIASIDILNLQLANKKYLDILRNRIGDLAYRSFRHVLEKKDSENYNDISETLGSIRNLFENILTEIARKESPDDYWYKSNQLKIRPFIGWINDYDKETKEYTYRLNSNSLLKNFLYDIQEIASDFGPHGDLQDAKRKEKPSGYQPTSNTVNALIYELKEIILWFNSISTQ